MAEFRFIFGTEQEDQLVVVDGENEVVLGYRDMELLLILLNNLYDDGVR